MPIIKVIEKEFSTVIIWKIEESEDQLLSKIDEKLMKEKSLSKLKHPQKKIEWLASRALLSVTLQKLKIAYSGLEKDSYGKPYLANSDYKVSITHSYKYCAVLISKKTFIGIDIETNYTKAHNLKLKYINDVENQIFDDNEKISTLIWSAKESIYKAYGKKGLIFKKDLSVNKIDLEGRFLNAVFNTLNLNLRLDFIQDENFTLTFLAVDF